MAEEKKLEDKKTEEKSGLNKPLKFSFVDKVLTDEEQKLFGKEDLEKFRKIADEEVLAEQKARLQAKLIEAYKLEARQALVPDEESVEVRINLAGFADRVMLDGTIFMHGGIYSVPRRQADVLADTIARGWEHDDEIRGNGHDMTRRQRGISLRPGDVARPATSFLRV